PAGAGSAHLTLKTRPKEQPGPETLGGYVHAPVALKFRSVRVEGLAGATTKAQDIYNRQVDRGELPGLVDNQYVSWLFEYGVLGVLICGLWVAFLLGPMFRAVGPSSLVLAARLVGVFVLVAALAVNVWEESPTDLVAALVISQAVAFRETRQ